MYAVSLSISMLACMYACMHVCMHRCDNRMHVWCERQVSGGGCMYAVSLMYAESLSPIISHTTELWHASSIHLPHLPLTPLKLTHTWAEDLSTLTFRGRHCVAGFSVISLCLVGAPKAPKLVGELALLSSLLPSLLPSLLGFLDALFGRGG